ncbi:outer membrane lipoprotein carrier protein LolA [Bacillaceae bacterium]
MRRIIPLPALLFLVFTLLTGCGGSKSAEDVVGDLNERLESLQSYRTNAKLTVQTGKEPQEYDVEIWHKKPSYYRIALTSPESNVTQIILRNDEGVFVLTPHLKKSFRFQSGWPENQGQVYLYESLAKSIIEDEERNFEVVEGGYKFRVKANYQTRSFSQQEIWLKEDLTPSKVVVMDSDATPLVEVVFSDFAVDVEFDNDAFDKERNLSGALLDAVPAMAGKQPQESFGVIEPGYVPEGVQFVGIDRVKGEGEPAVVLRYKGNDYQYTLMEKRPVAQAVSVPYGDPVDLGFAFGVLSGTDLKSLTWIYDGVEFTLTGNLPEEEMIEVAKSVFGQPGK